MKPYDKIILDHYRTVAERAGLQPDATMADNRTRQLETELICRFVELAMANLAARGQRPEEIVIADVGCGNGYTLEVVRRLDARPKLIGYEYSPELRALAASRFADGGVEIRDVDIRKRNTIGPEEIDILICQRVLINLLDRGDQAMARDYIVDAVRQGGHLLFIEAFQHNLDLLNQARAEFGIPPISPAQHNLYMDASFFEVPNLIPLSDPFLAVQENFLSTHYFVSRVLHPLVLGDRPFRHNSMYVSFMTRALKQEIGDYSPLRAKIFVRANEMRRVATSITGMPDRQSATDARTVLLGGGGHAAVVIEAMRAIGLAPTFILDRDPNLWGVEVLGVPVRGGDSRLLHEQATHFIITRGTLGTGIHRQRLYDECLATGLLPLTVIHPKASVSPSAKIGIGSVILAGAAICAEAEIGCNVIVNTNAIVEHHCRVGDHVHIATSACLCGNVTVGESAFVGAGSSVRQGSSIGARALVGLGACVVDDIRADATVMGVPAREYPR